MTDQTSNPSLETRLREIVARRIADTERLFWTTQMYDSADVTALVEDREFLLSLLRETGEALIIFSKYAQEQESDFKVGGDIDGLPWTSVNKARSALRATGDGSGD